MMFASAALSCLLRVMSHESRVRAVTETAYLCNKEQFRAIFQKSICQIALMGMSISAF